MSDRREEPGIQRTTSPFGLSLGRATSLHGPACRADLRSQSRTDCINPDEVSGLVITGLSETLQHEGLAGRQDRDASRILNPAR